MMRFLQENATALSQQQQQQLEGEGDDYAMTMLSDGVVGAATPTATDEVSYLTQRGYKIILVAGMISSALSMFGSVTICYLVLKKDTSIPNNRSGGPLRRQNSASQLHIRSRRRKLDDLYHRLVFGLSVVDLLFSSSLLFHPFLVPSETGFPYAFGTDQSCTVVGFFFQFYFSSYCYNCFLGLYFFLMIRTSASGGKRTSNDTKSIQNWIEPWVHILAVGVPLGCGIVGVFLEGINITPFFGVCGFHPYPYNCMYDDDVECQRGSHAGTLSNIHALSSFIMAIFGLIFTYLVWHTVYRGYGKLQHSSSRRHEASLDGSWVHQQQRSRNSFSSQQQKRLQTTATQAMLYAAAYLNGLVWVIVANVIEVISTTKLEDLSELGNRPIDFAVVLLGWTFFPLQGFFNWMIYIRPRLVRIKERNPIKSWYWSYCQIFSGDDQHVANCAVGSSSLRHIQPEQVRSDTNMISTNARSLSFILEEKCDENDDPNVSKNFDNVKEQTERTVALPHVMDDGDHDDEPSSCNGRRE